MGRKQKKEDKNQKWAAERNRAGGTVARAVNSGREEAISQDATKFHRML